MVRNRYSVRPRRPQNLLNRGLRLPVPQQIHGLVRWFDPALHYLYQDAAGTTPFDATTPWVGRWASRVGNGSLVQATTAKKPEWIMPLRAWRGSRMSPATLISDGTDDSIGATFGAEPLLERTFVIQLSRVEAGNSPFAFTPDSSDYNNIYAHADDQLSWRDANGTTAISQRTLSRNGNVLTLRVIDGVLEAQLDDDAPTTLLLADPDAALNNGLVLFARSLDGAGITPGIIGHIVDYSRALDDEELSAVRWYFIDMIGGPHSS